MWNLMLHHDCQCHCNPRPHIWSCYGFFSICMNFQSFCLPWQAGDIPEWVKFLFDFSILSSHTFSLSLNLLTGNRVRCPSVNLSRNLRKLQITPLSQCISFLLSSLCGKLFFYLRPLFPWKAFRFYVSQMDFHQVSLLLVFASTLGRTITICCVYAPPSAWISQQDLEGLLT